MNREYHSTGEIFFAPTIIFTLLLACPVTMAQTPEPRSGAAQSHSVSGIQPTADSLYGRNNFRPIQPLQIGDTIPESLWHLPLQVVNHPEGKDTITLNDYRGKLIILDFDVVTKGTRDMRAPVWGTYLFL